MKIATTFGASTAHRNSIEYKEGVKIGSFLAKKGFIVKCGGYGGLMEAISKGVRKENGECIGVLLEKFEKHRNKNPFLTKRVVCKTLYERIEKLIEGTFKVLFKKEALGLLTNYFSHLR